MVISHPETLFDEVIDFLTSSPSPEQIIEFEPSARLSTRLHYLLDQNQADEITSEEQSELDEFLQMNHFVNMLKIRAREKVANS
ncbi:MAG: hypothetical protein RLP44_09875 [Aggregatilineales bacterium]